MLSCNFVAIKADQASDWKHGNKTSDANERSQNKCKPLNDFRRAEKEKKW